MRMKTVHDQPIEKIYWSIGELAERLSISTSKIRYWCDFFDIKTARTKNGDRKFNKENLATISMIHYLTQEERYTLEGVRNRLESSEKAVHPICEICGKNCEWFAANPDLWPVPVLDKFYHQGCLSGAIRNYGTKPDMYANNQNSESQPGAPVSSGDSENRSDRDSEGNTGQTPEANY